MQNKHTPFLIFAGTHASSSSGTHNQSPLVYISWLSAFFFAANSKEPAQAVFCNIAFNALLNLIPVDVLFPFLLNIFAVFSNFKIPRSLLNRLKYAFPNSGFWDIVLLCCLTRLLLYVIIIIYK